MSSHIEKQEHSHEGEKKGYQDQFYGGENPDHRTTGEGVQGTQHQDKYGRSEKGAGSSDGESMHQGKHNHDQYLHLDRKYLWYAAGGAIGAASLFALGKLSGKIRPSLVGAAKEGYAFKEWAMEKYETTKEDVEDIVAEGVHAYYKDLDSSANVLKKEKNLLEKLELWIDKKLKKKNGDA